MSVEISAVEAKKSSGRRVLVVDDEMLIRWSMAETLTHAGLRVLSKPVEIHDLVPLIEEAYESLTR